MPTHTTFARYNRWANARLYDAAAGLSDADYRADRGAAFRSVHGTLNHLLVGDRIWLRRLTGEGDAPSDLHAILHDDFASLRAARECLDARIVAFADNLDEERIEGDLVYSNMSGKQDRQPLALVLAHLFNHQTHHRGQVHALIDGMGYKAPSLDLIYYLREAPAA